MKNLFAAILTVLFISSFSVSYATISTNDLGIEIVDKACDKCGKDDCKGCEGKAEKKKECTTAEKKACCSKGASGKSCKGSSASKKEASSENKVEEEKK